MKSHCSACGVDAWKAGWILALIVTCLLVSSCGPAPEPSAMEEESGVVPPRQLTEGASVAIESLLDIQVAAWNRGDIPAFMDGYWKSPKLRFASGGSVTRGWQVTLDGYLARYPDAAAMGTLRFEDREVQVLHGPHALVFGRWILDRENDQPQGLFTLLLERFEDASQEGEYHAARGWRVVADHTSSQ